MDTADSAYIDGSWPIGHQTDDDEESGAEYHPSSQHAEDIDLMSDEESDQDINLPFELAPGPDGGASSGAESDGRGDPNDGDTSGTRSITQFITPIPCLR